jgi:SAM-dependent methyltransferase
MNDSRGFSDHFDRIASKYAEVRDTDPHVVDTIIAHIPRHERPVDVMDIGCGTGRYTRVIIRKYAGDLRLVCCDYSSPMLAECSKRLSGEFPGKAIHYSCGSANDLPFYGGSLDGIITFNAVHHFDLDRFATGASRVLRPGGVLAIYTRTPEQNTRTIWGKHFPGFTEHETRLYSHGRLKRAIDAAAELRLEGIEEFKNERTDSIESLLHRAYNFHYSTFVLYPRHEFSEAVRLFSERLSHLSKDGMIRHTAENTLVVACRIEEVGPGRNG